MKTAERPPRDPAEEPEPSGGDVRDDADAPRGGAQAIYLYAFTRAKGWRSGPLGRPDEGLQRVRYRDLEAIVRPVVYEVPPLDLELVRQHQQVVDAALRRGTVLPTPYGIVFRGRRQLIRMLQEQYLVLDEGLSFLEGHWELRLHIAAAQTEPSDFELGDLAMQLYSDLRRAVRAAVPFAVEEPRLLSAAFLVERASWLEFMERAEELGSAHPELTFDITGPWPAYDFVRIIE